MPSFPHCRFTKHLLCANHWSRYWSIALIKADKNPCLYRAGADNKQRIKTTNNNYSKQVNVPECQAGKRSGRETEQAVGIRSGEGHLNGVVKVGLLVQGKI